jgi:hypothetical protein
VKRQLKVWLKKKIKKTLFWTKLEISDTRPGQPSPLEYIHR